MSSRKDPGTLKGAKKQPNDWRGAPDGYSLFGPVPHIAERFSDPLTPTEEKILNWFRDPKGGAGKRQANDVWVCGQHSYAEIARGTKLHWSTIKRNIVSLLEKQSLDTREVWAHDKKGGRRLGTLYSIPAYEDALERRRRIKNIALTPTGHPLYIGRAKRLLTLEKARNWSIDLSKVPPSSAKETRQSNPPARTAAGVESAAAAKEEAAAAAIQDTGPPGPKEEKMEDYPRVIRNAFRDCVRQKLFGHGYAVELIRKARKLASDRGEAISDSEIADAIYAGAKATKNGVAVISFYATALPEKVTAILDARADAKTELAENGGVCPICNGVGIVSKVVRGIGAQETCVCRQKARAAG